MTKGVTNADNRMASKPKTGMGKTPVKAKNIQTKRTTVARPKGVRPVGVTQTRPASEPSDNYLDLSPGGRKATAAAQEARAVSILGGGHVTGKDFIDLYERQSHDWTRNQKAFAWGVLIASLLLIIGFVAGAAT